MRDALCEPPSAQPGLVRERDRDSSPRERRAGFRSGLVTGPELDPVERDARVVAVQQVHLAVEGPHHDQRLAASAGLRSVYSTEVKDDSLTGADVLESSLGQVPSANGGRTSISEA
jgi:hypothetical protein